MKKKMLKKGRFDLTAKRGMVLLLCILVTGMFAGCGAGGRDTYDMKEGANSAPEAAADALYTNDGSIHEESAVTNSGIQSSNGMGTESAGILDGRKLIQNVRLEVETKEYDQMMSALEAQILELGGYIESMDAYNGSSYSDYRSSRYADLSIRIPSGRLNGFLQTVSDISNIVRRYDSVEDVTLSYVDMESRRDTLRTEQSRLLEFLERAETVEEIIALEERLSEVRYQLESMESQLRTIDNLVDYSTVNIHISEVRELTQVVEEDASVAERIKGGFKESLEDIGSNLTEVCIWFLIHIPYLVIWAVIILLAVIAWRRCRKKQIQKQEARRREAEARMQSQQAAMRQWESSGQGQAVRQPEPGRQTMEMQESPNDQRQK